ncbi:peptidase, S9A/B/C family, catalytic domain protein [Dictyocaulus viviparus]|uniref:Peptidase, S9A/B/C family, catalytic domain protein n=1 Tax=Dictyocaulus viviparus TaxID=29172 RepID=A0A0D8XMG4_DICVI|nr:peptidase, S9A/B/C family, catalytic domain protein [Dictyocaulus viviparus]
MIFLLFVIPFVIAKITPIIPRDLLFSNIKYSALSVSPNGRLFGYIAPDDNDVKNVFVVCVSCKYKRQVTYEKTRDILEYSWTGVPDIIVYMQDNNGAVMSNPHERTVISDRVGVRAVIIGNNMRDTRILVGLNDEDPALSERANLSALTTESSNWEQHIHIQADDTSITSPITFDKCNDHMFWLWSDETTDLGKVVMFPFDYPEQKVVLYTATRAQIEDIIFHPTDKTLLALTEVYHQPEIFATNNTIVDDLQYLVNLRPHGSLDIMSTSLDMSTWLVTYISSDKPYEIFLYRKWMRKAEYLFNIRPELLSYKLNRQIGFNFKARDDVVIQAYISLPPDVALQRPEDVPIADRGYAELGMIPRKPQKLVVYVHGGPTYRDYYGFSSANAWLTNRGYAVLQVNFRGSSGFGKRLVRAGDGEWGRKMHYDILDSIEFAVAKGITNRSTVAIMGGSYGGYETLVALTFTPDRFACGIDIVGPSNLITTLQTIPPYWKGFYKEFVRLLGTDIDTEKGRESLTTRSPLFYADQVTKPIMIFQGANDPRVKQHESDQFVEALKKNDIPVSYILYPDEGHEFRKASNELAMCGLIEKFLHSCLGGRYEPYHLGQYNSSAIIKSDDFIKGDTKSTQSSFNTTVPTPQLLHRRCITC